MCALKSIRTVYERLMIPNVSYIKMELCGCMFFTVAGVDNVVQRHLSAVLSVRRRAALLVASDAAGLPGHCCRHRGAAQDRQESGACRPPPSPFHRRCVQLVHELLDFQV